MDMILWMNYQTIGTIAFFAGVVLLLIELLRHGLSKLSVFSYACFVLSSVFLSSSILMGAIAIAGLSVLFGILLKYYRRERRRLNDNDDGDQS
jgi:membrane protein implicated in regulation of membrane protease activity